MSSRGCADDRQNVTLAPTTRLGPYEILAQRYFSDLFLVEGLR